MTANPKHKRVLLINAVVWSALYDGQSPLRDVPQWFRRWFEDLPQIALETRSAEEDVLAAVRAGVDGVMISGSPRDAWNDDPVNLKLCDLVRLCQERGVPLLGVCYGHQVLGRALGGVVARHPQGVEVGNTAVELTPSGQASPLFHGMPPRFEVLSSHFDAVLETPPGGELLVRGEFTLNQAFHWNKLLYGVQFHPESDPDVMRYIWSVRRDIWRSKVSFDLDRTLDNLRPTALAGAIIRNFVTRIIP